MAALRKILFSKSFKNISASYCLVRELRTSIPVVSKGNPLEYFLRDDVQTIIQRITGFDPDQTFFAHMVSKAERPRYKVLTDEELKQAIAKAESIKEERLQMPPFMMCRQNREALLSDDPEIAPALTSKYVFVDISRNTNRIQDYSHRPVVCRHEDGKLTLADWQTVDRMTQIYAPVPGREVYMPKMFEEEHLENLLKSHKYLYVLERACVQFEPDSSDFIRVTHRIYEHVAEHEKFDVLRCTRFFGPMSFYFAWINKVEPLLADMINKDLLVDAVDLINLKRIIHNQNIKEGDILTIIKDYCIEDSNKLHMQELRVALNKLDKRLEEKYQKKSSVNS